MEILQNILFSWVLCGVIFLVFLTASEIYLLRERGRDSCDTTPSTPSAPFFKGTLFPVGILFYLLVWPFFFAIWIHGAWNRRSFLEQIAWYKNGTVRMRKERDEIQTLLGHIHQQQRELNWPPLKKSWTKVKGTERGAATYALSWHLPNGDITVSHLITHRRHTLFLCWWAMPNPGDSLTINAFETLRKAQSFCETDMPWIVRCKPGMEEEKFQFWQGLKARLETDATPQS